MSDLLDRLLDPDDGAGIQGRPYNTSCLTSIPADHVHHWWRSETNGVEYWACGCLATRSYPPEET